MRGRNQHWFDSGINPRRVKGMEKRVPSAAILTSAGRLTDMPKPMAGPLRATMMNFFSSYICMVIRPPGSRLRPWKGTYSVELGSMPSVPEISTPLQK
jgi:hypothetical protein